MNILRASAFMVMLALSLQTLHAQTPTPAQPVPTPTPETKEHRDARMAWWRDARFGMFIHWGVFSVPADWYRGKMVDGASEWLMKKASIPVAEYRTYAKQFNPVKFKADEWVKVAKDAGMKYIVVTTKHHDGFAMFDSKASDFNIVKATPYAHDPIQDLAVACRKAGMKLGFYYSQAQDWNNRGASTYGKWDKAQEGDMDEYLNKVSMPQIREILSNYGPDTPVILWYDTPAEMTPKRAAKIDAIVKQLRPDIITNNRLGGGIPGDTETPEQFIPVSGYPGRDWETCMTMNDSWGFKKGDDSWKSTAQLLRNLCNVASKGGNYLLNVGPTSEGEIPEQSIERLRAIGAWMKVNGEAIYGSHAGPFGRPPLWGRATAKDGKVYLCVFDWPADGKLSVPLLGKISGAWLLTAPDKKIEITPGQDGFDLHLPTTAPDPYASVIVLQPDGPLTPAPYPPIPPAADGTVTLKPLDADIVGGRLRPVGDNGDYLGYWQISADYPQWTVKFDHPGTYDVAVEYACAAKDAGGTFAIVSGDHAAIEKVSIQATKNSHAFQVFKLGRITIDSAGVRTIAVKAKEKSGPPIGKPGLMNLKSVTLVPVKD